MQVFNDIDVVEGRLEIFEDDVLSKGDYGIICRGTSHRSVRAVCYMCV